MIKILAADYCHQVLTLISSSTTSIDILCYVFTFNVHKRSDRANLIYTALTRFQDNAGRVRVILDMPKLHKPNYHPNKFATRRLTESSIAVRHLHSGDTQHAKLFIYDRKIAIVGSHNITPSSLRNRHDLSTSLDDPSALRYLNSYFDSIWETSIEA